MPPEQHKDVHETPPELLPNKLNDTDLRGLVRSLIKPPPLGKNKNKPYYRHVYGLQMREVFDELMQDKATRIYRYTDFPEYSANTLYLKVMQAKEYLMDNLDPEGCYKAFDQCVSTHKKYGVGVIIEIHHDILAHITANSDSPMNAFKPAKVIVDGVTWRDRLDIFLEDHSAQGEFKQTGLMLDEDEQRELEVTLYQLVNISYKITNEKVIVVKIPSK